jgi:uncharacterized protein
MLRFQRVSRTALWVAAIICVGLASGTILAQSARDSAPRANYSLPNSQTHDIASKITGRTHRLFVAFPSTYATTSNSYPVLYVLDGDIQTVLASQIVEWMAIGRHIPQVLVVSIGYGDDAPGPVFVQGRERDFTPTAVSDRAGSGGASKFLQFLTREAVPFIDGMYRTDPGNRTLYGFSLGGLFVANVLLERDTTFQRFIILSPALYWDNQLLLRRERESGKSKRPLAATVFMSVGSRESAQMVSDFRQLTQHLRAEYPEMKLTTTELDGETHQSSIPSGLMRGLRAVFPAPQVSQAQ